jgi:hypothetical protein
VVFLMDKVVLGHVFSEYFPLSIIPPIAPHSLQAGAGTTSQIVAEVPSELSLTSPETSHDKRFPGQDSNRNPEGNSRPLPLRQSVRCDSFTR